MRREARRDESEGVSRVAVKLHVKKNDLVAVISGDDKGREGKVLEVRPRERRVIVEGVNIQKKHMKPTRTNPQGGVVEQPGPLPVSKVMLVCPSCKRPVRVGYRRGEKGRIRVCKRCGKDLD